MIANKNIKVIGPGKSPLTYSSTPVYQRGEGLASFFKTIVKSSVKKIASSATAKTAAKKLTKHGTEAVADLVADVVAGDDPSIKAKQKLDEARKDIANVIRN